MSLSEDEIKHVAHLARLEISAPEIPVHAKNLSNILDLVAQMNKVNTDNIEPMAHPESQENLIMEGRPDKITESNVRDLMLSIAPSTENGLFLVPKVIDEG